MYLTMRAAPKTCIRGMKDSVDSFAIFSNLEWYLKDGWPILSVLNFFLDSSQAKDKSCFFIFIGLSKK